MWWWHASEFTWPGRMNDASLGGYLVVGLVVGLDAPLLELLDVLAVLDVRVRVVVALEVLVEDVGRTGVPMR